MGATSALCGEVLQCEACSLRQGCAAPVPGVGPDSPSLMVVIDHPDVEDDLMGEPASGARGKLVKNLFVKAGFADAYFTNAVKCLPARGEKVTAGHLNACRLWVLREIDLLKPRGVVCLGKTAARSVLVTPKTTFGAFYRVRLGPKVLCWHSIGYMFTAGKKADEAFVNLLKEFHV